MKEKTLFRLTLGVVLWIVVATPYMILYPSRPEGDLTISTDSRGVMPSNYGEREPLKREVIREKKAIDAPSLERSRFAESEILAVTEVAVPVPMISVTPPVTTVSETRNLHRGIFIECGKRSEVMLSLHSRGRGEVQELRETSSRKISIPKERVADSDFKSRLKGIVKTLPDDLFEISRHWNETNFSGPSDVGDLIFLLEGYRE